MKNAKRQNETASRRRPARHHGNPHRPDAQSGRRRANPRVSTGIPFFDHMLTLFAKHAAMDLKLALPGAIWRWTPITRWRTADWRWGRPFARRWAAKRASAATEPVSTRAIPCAPKRYVPMDECLARCVVDFGGRPYLVWRGLDSAAHKKISAEEKNQDASSAFRFGLAREFFQAFANEARCNLHLELLYGDEPHHIVEALFKAFARAADAACQRDPRIAGRLPSTKGKL